MVQLIVHLVVCLLHLLRTQICGGFARRRCRYLRTREVSPPKGLDKSLPFFPGEDFEAHDLLCLLQACRRLRLVLELNLPSINRIDNEKA
jgi:hypothetical protein